MQLPLKLGLRKIQHVVNWLQPLQFVCGAPAEGASTMDAAEVSCPKCVAQLKRTGLDLGWSEVEFKYWSIEEMQMEVRR